MRETTDPKRNQNKIALSIIIPTLIAACCIAVILIIASGVVTPQDLRGKSDPVMIDAGYAGFESSIDNSSEIPEYTYTFTLPEISRGGELLAVWMVHRDVIIMLDDEIVYDSSILRRPFFTDSPGRYWAIVPVSEVDSGRTVSVLARPAYTNLPDFVPEMLVAGARQISSFCISREWILLLACILCIIFGAHQIMLVYVLNADRESRRRSRYMGLFITILGIYRLLDAPLITLIFNRHSQLITLSALILFIIVPYVFYKSLSARRPENRAYSFWSMIFGTSIVMMIVLQILGIRDLRQNMEPVYVLLLISYVGGIIWSVNRKDQNFGTVTSRWIAAIYMTMFISLLVDMSIYLKYGFTRHSNVSMYMALVYGIVSEATMMSEIRTRQEAHRIAELKLAEQKGAMLLSQIRPHFIYNTLNTIYSLCDIDVEKAKSAIHDFSGYMRLHFQSIDRNEPIDFSTELQLTRFYLSIEQLRFGDDLEVEFDIRSSDFKLPAISLQPIVENAIRHGLRAGSGRGRVRITTYRQDNTDHVVVEDDGVGFDVNTLEEVPGDGPRKHTAIANVRERVERLCGGTFTIESTIGSGTRAEITIPVEE